MPAMVDPHGARPYSPAPDSNIDVARKTISLGSRIRTVVHRAELARALAEGTDPSASGELELRARQLTSQRNRRRLAAHSLRRTIAEARRPAMTRAPVIIERAAVLDADDAITGMIKAPRQPTPCSGGRDGDARADPHERGSQPALQRERARSASAGDPRRHRRTGCASRSVVARVRSRRVTRLPRVGRGVSALRPPTRGRLPRRLQTPGLPGARVPRRAGARRAATRCLRREEGGLDPGGLRRPEAPRGQALGGGRRRTRRPSSSTSCGVSWPLLPFRLHERRCSVQGQRRALVV